MASKHIDTETANDYRQLTQELLDQGFVILAVTIDGKRGVAKAFGDVPVQMCHFHQIAIIKRYLNTTNSLDGGVFSQLKKLIKLHQGLAIKRKVKLIDEQLYNYNKR